MKLLIKILLLFFLLQPSTFAQKEANNWYFGYKAGITFNTLDGSPIALTDGSLNTLEGCATISNTNGNLLFYTDGLTVWNKQHKVMENGSGLYGHISSTQSSIIVPFIGNDQLYYIFTVSRLSSKKGFCYSIVDLNYNGGLGKITEKNNQILSEVTEKLTAVKHDNNKDYWVITHGWNNNQFYALLITDNGISISPVISEAGMVHEGTEDYSIGYLKASPDGSKLSCAIYGLNAVEVFHFNNSNGEVKYYFSIDPGAEKYPQVYGTEFSASGDKLYFTLIARPSKIYQLDMSAGSVEDILKSLYLVAIYNMREYYFGAMQIGPDSKIYIACDHDSALSVINSPEEKGVKCDFNLLSLNLNGALCGEGLPTFVQSFFQDVNLFSNGPICEGDTLFLFSKGFGEGTIDWTGPNGFNSASLNPVIPDAIVNMSGTYTALISFPNNNKTIEKKIEIIVHPKPSVSIIPSENISICEGDSVILKLYPDVPYVNYLWSTGDIGSQLIVKQSGKYSVISENEFGCLDSDFVEVNVYPYPLAYITMNEPTSFCKGDSIILTANPQGSTYTYLWSNGSTESEIIVKESEYYSVIVTSEYNCESASEEVNINVISNQVNISSIDEEEFIRFDTTAFGHLSCTKVNISNVTDDNVYLDNIFFSRNIEFSLPQSQFPLIIPPGESREVDMCFSPSIIGEDKDTLIFSDKCASYNIPCIANGKGDEYTGSSNCNVNLKMITTDYIYSKHDLISKPYPNPVTDIAVFNFRVQAKSNVTLKLYNIIGVEVANLVDETLNKGDHSITFYSNNLASGIYFYKYTTGDEIIMGQILLKN
ncbi:T9SS type A sorting domain-containing protein [Bacteroidota bacterium]